jgi:hypothetical protein
MWLRKALTCELQSGVSFQVLTAVSIKTIAFWDIALHHVVEEH